MRPSKSLLLALALLLFSGFAHASLRIGVITMEPGQEFWERFGHDAILVQDTGKGTAISYNFGFFDLDEPGFVGNFVRGRMMYYLVALPVDEDLSAYRQEGRGVTLQWLDFSDGQAQAHQY